MSRADDGLLLRCEKDLAALLRAIDPSVDGWPASRLVAVGFGLRGRDLYKAFRHQLSGGSMPATAVILRAIVDLAILSLWIEADPETHLECWFAEDDRSSLVAIDAFLEMGNRRGHPRKDPYSAAERAESKRGLLEFREIARAAGIRLPRKASLIPSIQDMAGESENAWEAYNVAYRLLSPWTHSLGRSFASDAIVHRSGGDHLKASFPFPKAQMRGLVVPLLCILLASVSRQAGLGIEAECDRIRLLLAVWPDPEP